MTRGRGRPWDILLGESHVLSVGDSAGLISGNRKEELSFTLLSGQACAEAISTGTEAMGSCAGLQTPG